MEYITLENKKMDEWLIKKALLLLAWIAAYFSPISEILIFVGFIVFIDTATGVLASKKDGTFKSKRLFSVVYKIIIYFSAIIISKFMSNIFDIEHIAKITASYIAYVEITSIDENSEKLIGRRVFSYLLDKIKRK